MLNKKILMGILVIVLVFAMTVIGCPKAEVSFEGTWLGEDGSVFILNDGNFEVLYGDEIAFMGAYSIDEDVFYLDTTHYNGYGFGMEDELFPIEEIAEYMVSIEEITVDDIEDFLSGLKNTFNFELVDNTLSFTMGGFPIISFTKSN